MTAADLEQLSGQLSAAIKQLQADMANMPPEQRQMMEKMMKGQMGSMLAAKAPAITVRKVASGEKVGPHTCDKYQIDTDGIKTEEVWTTSWDSFGLSEADFKVFEDLGKFMLKLSGPFAGQIQGMMKAYSVSEGSQIQGIPVKIQGYSQGKLSYISELVQVRQQAINPASFEVPTGYKKDKLGTLR